MSSYTEQVLIDKLSKMSESQQSIQTLSHWIMFHKKRYVQSVQIWKQELFRAAKNRKLLFLYLANDIMQSSRKRGGEFIKEFSKEVQTAVAHVLGETPKAAKALRRLVDIWEERRVFPADFTRELRGSLGGSDVVMTTKPSVPSPELMAPPAENPTVPVIDALREAADADWLLEMIRERIPPSPLDFRHATSQAELSSLANELDDNCSTLQQCKDQLEQNIEKRTTLISQLTDFLEQQETNLSAASELLQDCTERLTAAEKNKQEMQTLYSSLPVTSDPRVAPKRFVSSDTFDAKRVKIDPNLDNHEPYDPESKWEPISS